MRETVKHTAIERASNAWENYTKKKQRYYVTFTDHLKLAPWQLRIRRCEHTKWKKENSEEVESWALQLERTADSHGVKVWSWKRWRSRVYTRPVSWVRDQVAISCRDLVRKSKSPSRNPSQVRIFGYKEDALNKTDIARALHFTYMRAVLIRVPTKCEIAAALRCSHTTIFQDLWAQARCLITSLASV